MIWSNASTVASKMCSGPAAPQLAHSCHHSDHGAQFTSSLWATLCNLLNIQHAKKTAYHPQSNGLFKNFHCHLKDVLRAHAPQTTGQTTCRGYCWASTHLPETTQHHTHSGSFQLTTHFTWPIFRFPWTYFRWISYANFEYMECCRTPFH